MMNRNYFNWIVALAIFCIAIVTIFMWKEKPTPIAIPVSQITQRPTLPFKNYISAVGIVEASSENIFIGSPVNRVVDKVYVDVGAKVKKGDVLFKLESRDLAADLETRRIAYENAKANLQKLESMPRPEDVAIAAAALRGVQVDVEQAKSQYDRVAGLQNSGAMSQEEVKRRHFAYMEALAKMQQAQADFEKTKSGAWLPDLEIARLKVLQAKADMQQMEAEIERTVIRSPLDATVLQVKIHEGEFPPSDSSRTPPMIIGNTDTLRLRVSINQFDASYYHQNAPAVAFLQGNPQVMFPLQFVQLEPYFVAKQNLNNDITEKVDTRVLQVIYAFKDSDPRIFVGQQMDVFIENQYAPSEET